MLGISGIFLSVSVFSQTHFLAAAAGPVLGDSPRTTSCAKGEQQEGRGLSLVEIALLPNMKSQLHDADALSSPYWGHSHPCEMFLSDSVLQWYGVARRG